MHITLCVLFSGLTGQVTLDAAADREPQYYIFHLGPEMEKFVLWNTVSMMEEPNNVNYSQSI